LYWPEDNRLAIIDWSPSDWLAGGVGTLGPRYADMTILLQSLFTSRPFGPHPIRERDKLGRVFLDAYAEHTNGDVRLDEFGEYSEALLAVFLTQRRKQMGLRFLAYQPSFGQLRQFVRRFCLQGRMR